MQTITRLLPLLLALASCASNTPPTDLMRHTQVTSPTSAGATITARASGFTHHAHVKTLLLRRAALEARAAGFVAFHVEPTGYWVVPGNNPSHNASAVITYSRVQLPDLPGLTYSADKVLDSPPVSEPASALASLSGSNASSHEVAWQNLRPVFTDTVRIDDVSAASFAFGDRVFLRPGVSRFLLHVMTAREPRRVPLEYVVPMSATLLAGRHYRVTGTADADSLVVWIEDVARPQERIGLQRIER